jgi:two-component system, OmpR family, sensor histidine kinase KdpD
MRAPIFTLALYDGRYNSPVPPDNKKTPPAASKTPDQWLEECATDKPRGIFKLFLGYAPGVGKTYSMLSEAIRRASRGEDVVAGVIESHGRKATAELAAKLDRVPPRKLEYKGTIFEEMDVDAILARKPAVAVIDELAHTNIEGSKHAKRYEDVIELLDAKIDVLSTMNVQHVESVGPTVQQITGVQIRETVPDWVMQRVDEIVLADLTPQALKKRMERGDVYPADRTQRALSHFFRQSNLIALRELALRQVTGVVDRSLDALLEKDGETPVHTVRERIGVCVSSNPAAQYLIARGSRMAQAMGGEFFVFYIDVGRDTRPEDQKTLADNISFAENLGAHVVRGAGSSIAEGLAHLVRENHITQVIFGRSARTGWQRWLYLSAIQRFLRDSPSVDVHIVSQEAK